MSSQQKAQKAQMRILARAVGCGWLVYIIIQMVQVPAYESGMNPAMRMAAIVVFSVGAAILGVLTLIEIVSNLKSGFYKASYYNDDPGILCGEKVEEEIDEEGSPDYLDDDSEESDELDNEPSDE